jgi:hypothetical protein
MSPRQSHSDERIAISFTMHVPLAPSDYDESSATTPTPSRPRSGGGRPETSPVGSRCLPALRTGDRRAVLGETRR